MKFNKIIMAKEYDPYYNLAREEILFDKDESYLLLWRNAPSVIIGRHQNTLKEADCDFLQENKIPLVRRMTGGGAVYHDMGNINISFLFDCKDMDFEMCVSQCMSMLLDALKKVGIKAYLSGRNDICVCDIYGMERKISGSAMMQRKNRGLLHATLLYSVALDDMSRSLTPSVGKMKAKGIASVNSRVVNIKELLRTSQDIEWFIDSIATFFIQGANAVPATDDDTYRQDIEELANVKYRNGEWNFGNDTGCTLLGSRKFPIGTVELNLKMDKRKIVKCCFTGDYIDSQPLEDISRALEGVFFDEYHIREVLHDFNCSAYWGCEDIDEVICFLMKGE